MGIRSDTSSTDGSVFSEDVLKIEISGPKEDYLTLIDVPGIFRTPTEGVTTKADISLVQKMVKNYNKDSRTVILAVLPSNVDPATQEILDLAKDFDSDGERTLGVLTKPDLVREHSAQVAVCNVILGKRKPLNLGYHVVRNRGADNDNHFDFDSSEQETFETERWSSLPKDRAGVKALKTRLGVILGQITRREFPKLRNEIRSQLTDCRRQLAGLGQARQSEQEQKLFLNRLSQKFQHLVQSALNGHYSNHHVFDKNDRLRLITRVVNITERFGLNFKQMGHRRLFHDLHNASSNNSEHDNNESDSGETSETTQQPSSSNFSADEENESEEFFKDLLLNDLTTEGLEVEHPEDGIMDWIEDLYRRSRGIELGTFGGAVLASAFKEQSSKWGRLTLGYMSHIIFAIHRFLEVALESLCTETRLRDDLWSLISDEISGRYKAAIRHAIFLVSIERDKRPYTLNHYFNENLQKSRGKRMADMLKDKTTRELQLINGRAQYSDNKRVVDIEDVRSTTASKSNIDSVKEDIHDILHSYYKVARKRFVDNLYRQAVDHYLLTGPGSPLSVFDQEWVIKLNPEQLQAIAGESPVVSEQRQFLQRKIRDLDLAMQILKF
jgi:Dynamin central region/Dynamin family